MAPRVSFLLVGVVLLLGLSAGAAPASNKEGDALYELRLRLSDPNGVLQSRDPTLVNPCTWFHVTCDHASRVFRLDLGNSNVSGSIGPEVIRLVNLQYLELYRNNLYGEIPKELGKLKNLINLDLYANKLTGRIPKSLSKLSSLRFIDLSNNDLCGTIPIDGPFSAFPLRSFENNSRLNGPELQGLIPYGFGC